MTDGKLVRDLIPDIIRRSGRPAEVRYLSGDDLVEALAAKLCEESREVLEAVGDRQKLIDELADVTEVMSALMEHRSIRHEDVVEAATAKAEQRGRFELGAWLASAIPSVIRRYGVGDVDAQRIRWIPGRWAATFTGYETAYVELKEHSEAAGGIARSFIHTRSNGDPVELFLLAMAWGYKPKDYGPTRTQRILEAAGARDNIAAIVEATRTEGAAAGWRALLTTHKIGGLNMSFGTKLLYFAGYSTNHRPRPLVLDERVRAALNRSDIAPGTVPPKGLVREADYLRYLELAEAWASDPGWNQQPDVVEYALFAQ